MCARGGAGHPNLTRWSVSHDALVNGAHGGEDARGVELDECLWQLVHGRGEADLVVVAVVNRVKQLHKHVAQDVHVLQASLVHAQWLNHVSTNAALRVVLVYFSDHPVM